jgi:hypothetical protein
VEEEEEEEESAGVGSLREVESSAPVTTGRGGTRHWVISGGARERRGVAGECHGGAPSPRERGSRASPT